MPLTPSLRRSRGDLSRYADTSFTSCALMRSITDNPMQCQSNITFADGTKMEQYDQLLISSVIKLRFIVIPHMRRNACRAYLGQCK